MRRGLEQVLHLQFLLTINAMLFGCVYTPVPWMESKDKQRCIVLYTTVFHTIQYNALMYCMKHSCIVLHETQFVV